MFSPLRTNVAASMGLVALLSTSAAWAQNQIQPGQPRQQQVQPQQTQQQQQTNQQQRQRYSAVPQGSQQAAHNDAQLAAWLIVDNQNEVALAKLGQDRAKSNDIKELCQKMRDDHQQFVSKLQPYADTMRAHSQGAAANNEQNAERRATENVNENARVAQAADPNNQQARQPGNAQTTAGANQGQMAHGLNFVALKRELGAQCLQSAEKALSEKSSAEFDECFLGMQIGIHHEAVVTMTVFRNHASPNLQQVLDQGIETAQAHLKHAEKLMKEERKSQTRTETSQR